MGEITTEFFKAVVRKVVCFREVDWRGVFPPNSGRWQGCCKREGISYRTGCREGSRKLFEMIQENWQLFSSENGHSEWLIDYIPIAILHKQGIEG